MPGASVSAQTRRRRPARPAAGRPPWRLDSAAQPPALPAEFVRRPAITGRLCAGGPATLALIVAPPGYGKSCLLADWAEQDERPFVWLSVATGRPARGATGGTDALDDGAPRVVVLDDADRLAPAVLRGVVDALWTRLPEDSVLALATRSHPDLALGRLRAHRALIEIGASDLAMSAADAQRLLRGAGFDLERDAVAALVGRTEGWPAALYLAALSLRDHPDAPEGVGGFGGDDHLVTEYLRDEVLSALPPRLMRFAMRTAIIDRLTGQACDAVTAEGSSALVLARLARTSPLLEPLDPAHDCFRWHPLVRECLLGELRRAEPECEPELHMRASAWYAERGDVDRAIGHACSARAAQRAGELLWAHAATYVMRGHSAQVRRWLDAFSAATIAEHAPLAVCAAHGALAAGHAEEAERWAGCAATAIAHDVDGARGRSLDGGLALVNAAIARGGARTMRDAAARARELVPEESAWRPMASLLTGVAEYLLGHGAAAARALDEMTELGGDSAPGVTGASLAQRAMIAIEAGEWDLAGELTDRALGVLVRHELAGEPASALAFAAAAAVRAHHGRADEAKRDLRSGIDLLATLGDYVPWYGAEARILLAYASLWLADVVGARTLLAQASRLARRMPDAIVFQRWFDDAWSQMDSLAEASLAGPSALTIAELRVLRFLPSHRSFREIADQLGVSANTVKTQAHAVYRKLGAASRSEAVARAEQAGLLGQ